MSKATLINGKAYAERLRHLVGTIASEFQLTSGRMPGLAVILVGEDPASQVYVRSKHKATIAANMASFEHRLDHSIKQDRLIQLVHELNQQDTVDGILVQLPLPDHIDDHAVIAAIDPAKDVDGFHILNAGRLAVGDEAIVPCTPLGCLMLLQEQLGDLSGKQAVIVGRSNIVGKPMAQLLLNANCTVTIAHSRTHDLPAEIRRADIVIAAVGRPEMIKGNWLKKDAVVIDVGINRIATEQPGKTRLVGDVATAEAMSHVRSITPVPGGVGPMTIAVLLRNTLVAAYARAGLPKPDNLD